MRAVPHLVLWRLGLTGAGTQTTERERQMIQLLLRVAAGQS